MTPQEYTTRLDALLRYVGGLLISSDRTAWEIGRTFALLTDSERPRYLAMLLGTSTEGTREYEIGWDLRALLLAWPETDAAVSA